MTILPISKRGTVKLPKEIHAHLSGADYLQVRITENGLTLTPVQIAPMPSLKASGRNVADAASDKN